jgi:hypothetical protein
VGLKLEKVVPWGRSMQEYTSMFNLTSSDLKLKIIDCAGGPASFNVEMIRQGYQVISCDPVYQFSADEIEQRIHETYETIVEGLKANLDAYVWQDIQSPEHLGEVRMAAMQQFLADFPLGLQQGRYLSDGLPALPFGDRNFDLALCSHFLFTYSEQLSAEFHLASILEMCRVAKQVRIFPLLNLAGKVSPLLEEIVNQLRSQQYQTQIQPVSYQFQKGGNQMLQVFSA